MQITTRALVVAAAWSTTVLVGAAQSRPNFSGVWIAIGQSEGSEFVVRQDAKTIRLGHDSEGGGTDHIEVYNLDGTETTTKWPSHGDFIVITGKATWEKEKLVVRATVVYPDGRRMATTWGLSLDESGRLVLESTQTMEGRPTETHRGVLRKK